MNLTDDIKLVPGIGPIVAEKLKRLGIETVFDLLHHLPFRYEDRRIISQISSLQAKSSVTIIGKIESIKNEYTKNGKNFQKAEVSDNTGKITVIWFNQSYLIKSLKIGNSISLYGKTDWFGRKLAIISPEISDPDSAGSIVSIYPETAGLTSKFLRKKIKEILDNNIFEDNNISEFPELNLSLRNIHFPKDLDVEIYRKRLAFDELIKLETEAQKRKQDWQSRGVARQFTIPNSQITNFISSLPYRLTTSQEITIKEILADLEKPVAMNRLLEGDVGSGKTVVAAVSALVAHTNNLKTLFMAPTQILVQQHFETLSKLLSPFNIKIGLATSQSKIDGDVIVGTQSLLSLDIKDVGLVVIDEQHRFGVAQRTLLQHKNGTPHVLTMTATPIPRTMALALYGDLDLSVLTDMPSGRKPVKTWVVPPEKRAAAIEWIKKQNTQVFWVCPLIDESESLGAIRAVNKEFEYLNSAFKDLRLGLLHGRMKNKDEIINKFKNKEIDILVATPVVEVGIDIPNANIMIIEDAYRFGLATLHQLRGRVGRGSLQGYCLLFSDKDTARLKAMETNHSGIDLSEIDFRLRGAGNIYGEAQHGGLNFKVARYIDLQMLPKVREIVKMLS